AFSGYGVWSLVAKYLLRHGISSILLWLWNRWKPEFVFSVKSFRELFGFGSKLLISGLINTLFRNINYFVIAKFFCAAELGYYTRAELFKNLLSENVSSTITAVGYPTLAKMQDDRVRMKRVFREMFINTFFIIVLLMSGLASTAKALILSLVGGQWLPSVELLQMLCFIGVMMPLNSMNINILNVVGRSDLYLKLQVISQILAIPAIVFGIFYGIKVLILGRMLSSLGSYIIFNHYSAKFIQYSLKEQLKDIFPVFLLAVFMGSAVVSIELTTNLNHWWTLILQLTTGILIVVLSGEIFKMKEYTFLKMTLWDKLRLILPN
ncbi:oligosaccharide flippase family protein, partial [bacterium]|nr:oligosaccharide flippase family protein [bacterium]